MNFRSIISNIFKVIGWLLVAALVGILVSTRSASGFVGLASGAGGFLLLVLMGRWAGRRWVLKTARYFWAPSTLLLFAGLIVAVRNTPLGVVPIHIFSMGLAALSLAVAMFGVLRYQGRAAMWRTATMVFASLGMLALVGYDATMAYRSETVTVTNDEVQLEGTILVPRGDGPFPAVLFVHGAGPERRSTSRPIADLLARRGYVTVTWDKRGSGASTGGSPRDSFEELATDVVAWAGFLGERGDVDPDKIILWGSSEGAWIAPLAAEQVSPAALVLVSPGVQFGDTLFYENGWTLRGKGFDATEVEQAISLRQAINDYYRTGSDRSRVLDAIEAVSDESWYQAAVGIGLLPTAGMVTEPGSPETVEFMERVDFTLLTALAKFDESVLAAVGLQDRCNPAAENAAVLGDFLADQGNDNLILEYPQAGHGILVWLTGERFCGGGIPPVSYPVGYLDFVVAWLSESLDPVD